MTAKAPERQMHFIITAGQASDSPQAVVYLMSSKTGHAIADKGYDTEGSIPDPAR